MSEHASPELLRILHVEDSLVDAELAQAAFDEAGLRTSLVRVETREAFVAELERGGFDLILADYHLPAFDGLSALALARERRPEVPLIIVSGKIGEERAVEVLKLGATDYVLKESLSKLPMAAQRALDEVRDRARLWESEEKYRSLVDGLPGFVYLARIEEGPRTLYVSRQIEGLTGYKAEEMLAEPGLWFVRLHPEDQSRLLEAARRDAGRGVRSEFEYRFHHKQGHWVWFRATADYFADAQGTLVRGFATDITASKRMEEQFLQAQKMEAIGRLAGGVAHDFNNLLTVIRGYSELSLARLDAQDATRPALEQIQKAADRAASLTRQLLAFSRQQVLEPKVIDLNTVVVDMEKMLQRLIGEDVRLVVRPGQELWRVKADPGQIEQVLLNLVVNARDAMPKGGSITIETSNVVLDERDAGRIEGARPGRYVVLTVADTGTGMDESTMARLFEPFFTTKERGKGTGLGLSTVYGIVHQSGGTLGVASELGRGSTFQVYLPRVEEPRTRSTTRARRAARPGSEMVLVVEDEEALRTIVCEFLKLGGYRVLEASDGEQALSVLRDHPQDVQLVLTDVVLPGMGGRELSDRVRAIRPGLKVLYMSGYTDDAILRQGVLGETAAFIQKPFTREDLARKVRDVLDASTDRAEPS